LNRPSGRFMRMSTARGSSLKTGAGYGRSVYR
jgi:hypothetical protein